MSTRSILARAGPVTPAVAAVLGVLVLQETFTVAMGIGLALVILDSTMATRPSRAVEGPEVASPMPAGADKVA